MKADRATRYAEEVTAGDIPVSKWTRLACERHIEDLHKGDWQFDRDILELVENFYRLLKHSKGEWAGRPFYLEDWQVFVVGSLLAWVNPETGLRRFRTGYIEAGRKNGKTSLAAGLGLYLLLADKEPGAEIYSAATMRAQARLTHGEAVRMVKSSPLIKQEVRLMRDKILVGNAARYEPLGADSDTLDGLNVHGAIVDEVHAHKDRKTWDVLETGTGSRRQPLMVGITTAGYDRHSLCFQLRTYTEQVLSRRVKDDSWFGIVYTVDDTEFWNQEELWVAANPNLGVCKKIEDLRRKAKRAEQMPSALNAFLRKELSIWTDQESRWISAETWDKNAGAVAEDGLRGRRCYGGLDLGSSSDLTVFVLVFPPEVDDEPYQVLCRFWVPEDAVRDRAVRDRVPYDVWVRQGHITATPGNITDYDYIVSEIDKLARVYDIQEIAFDRWGASQVQTKLMDMGGEEWVVGFGQGYRSISPPMKELERLLLAGRIAHGGHPVLAWNAGNVVSISDPAGNVKVDKRKSLEKVDGVVALIMALDRSLRQQVASKSSAYEERGLLTF